MDFNELLKDKELLIKLIDKKDAEIKEFLEKKGLKLSDEQFDKVKEAVKKLSEGKDEVEKELKSKAEDLLKGGLGNLFKK